MKLVYLKYIEFDHDAVYLDGKYIIGEYYVKIEGIVAIAKAINPDIEIECWYVPLDENGEGIEYPIQLPDDYISFYNLKKIDFQPW